MNSQDYRNLQEAYLNVYQELDEKVLGQDPEMRRARTKDDKRLSPSSGKGYADNQKKSISYMNKLTKNNKIIPGMTHEEVEEFDEAVYGGTPKKPEAPKDDRMVVTNADKKGNTPAYQNLMKGNNRYKKADHMGEATAMAKRGLNEPEIRNKIAAKTSASGAGKFADKATKLADRETYGNKEMKAGREKLARTQRGDFRDTTSSSPGLRGYGYKSNDPAVKAKQDARGNQRARAALTPNERKQLNMGFDLYDVILAHLLAEGYADTNENALVIMANMSEEWREDILTEVSQDEFRAGMMKAAKGMPSDVRTPSKDELFGSKEERSKIKLPKGVVNPTPDTSANIRKSSEYSSPRASRGLPAVGYN